MAQTTNRMDSIVSLAKRRGFVYPSSEIYGGIANTWDFGPLGVLMKHNIKTSWWKRFVQTRMDMVGLDSAIFMNSKVWVASGHVANFNDAMVDCKKCKSRFRADHIIEDALGISAEGLSVLDMTKLIRENRIVCPIDGGELTDARLFNTMFKTKMGPTSDDTDLESTIYLRPETCQSLFVDFKNVLNSTRKKVPFGIAQIGKAFRNEITPGNFIFRVLEFEQMEIEYFVKPGEDKDAHNVWLDAIQNWYVDLRIKPENIRRYEHSDEERSFYSSRTVDFQYNFPFGWKELHGVANRTDYDLNQHAKFSGQDLFYYDEETKTHFNPYVIEPSVSVERVFLALLVDAYEEEILEKDTRTVLHLHPSIAPIKAAILPLMKRDGMAEEAQTIAKTLMNDFSIQYDETGSIGKRYRRQDEIGTPLCVTVDYDTLKDKTVTIRHRDSMKQDRVAIVELEGIIRDMVR